MASSKLLKLILELRDDASKKMQGFTGSIEKNKAAIRATGVAMTAMGGVITGTIGMAVSMAAKQEQQEQQLAATLKSTGGAAGMSAKEVTNLASKMQALTGIGDETVLAGQNMLLTFTNIGKDVFPQTTETLLDMATAMNNGAAPSAEMLKSQAIQLGKALNNPAEGITALTRVGVKFTEKQKDMIKSMTEAGDVTGAQKVILDELGTEFGGKAAANMKTFSGQLTALKGVFGDFMEQIGFAVIPVLKDLGQKIIPIVKDVIAWTKEHPKLTQTIVLVVGAIGALMLVLGPLLVMLPGIVTAVGILEGVFVASTIPIFIVIAAIAALIAIGVYLVKHWADVKAFSIAMWQAYRDMAVTIFTAVKNFFINIFTAIKDFIVGIYTKINNFLIGIHNTIRDFIINIWNAIKDFIVNLLTSILNTYVTIWTNIFNAIGGILGKIKGGMLIVWNAIKGFLVTIVTNIATNMVNGWNNLKSSVIGVVTSLGDSITGFFTGLATAAWDWGANIVQGIINGLKAKIQAVKNMAKEVANAVMKFMPAHSPSEEGPFRNIIVWGENLTKGFAEGVIKGKDDLQRVLGNTIGTVGMPISGRSTEGYAPGISSRGQSVVVYVSGNTFMGTPQQFADQIQQIIQKRLQGSLKF